VDGLRVVLDDDQLDRLAVRISEQLAGRLHYQQEDRWLSTQQAADYLGVSVSSLHRLTAGRQIPFEQEGPNCRCYFRRSDLDDWRSNGGG